MIENARMHKPTTAEVLTHLIEARKITNLAKAAREMGVNQSTLYRVKSGGMQKPSASTLRPIAAYFGVTIEQLTGVQPLNDGDLAENRELRRVEPVRLLPLISWVRAGDFCATSNPYEPGDAMEWVPVYDKVSELSYVLEVRGDSMNNPHGDPSFPEGTRIIVDPDEEVMPNRYVIARIADEDEVTFKRLMKDGGRIYLKALNPAYPAILVDDRTDFCGVVVAIAQRNLL